MGEGKKLLFYTMKRMVPDWKLTTHAKADAAGCDLVRQWLREHNGRVNGAFMRKLALPEHEAVPLVILAESGEGILGGLLGETQLSWLRISIMAVDPRQRFKGIGAGLLKEAERTARERGCKHVYVDTMSCQAPEFYLRQGYRLVGQINDWDSHGHTKCFFTKELGPGGDEGQENPKRA